MCVQDVVTLQEVWVGSDADKLVACAQQAGLKHAIHFKSGVFGSGLVTMSRCVLCVYVCCVGVCVYVCRCVRVYVCVCRCALAQIACAVRHTWHVVCKSKA